MADYNYAYIVVDIATGEVALIDAADVAEVKRMLGVVGKYFFKNDIVAAREKIASESNESPSGHSSRPQQVEELKVVAIMSTHNHHDHAGGNLEVGAVHRHHTFAGGILNVSLAFPFCGFLKRDWAVTHARVIILLLTYLLVFFSRFFFAVFCCMPFAFLPRLLICPP